MTWAAEAESYPNSRCWRLITRTEWAGRVRVWLTAEPTAVQRHNVNKLLLTVVYKLHKNTTNKQLRVNLGVINKQNVTGGQIRITAQLPRFPAVHVALCQTVFVFSADIYSRTSNVSICWSVLLRLGIPQCPAKMRFAHVTVKITTSTTGSPAGWKAAQRSLVKSLHSQHHCWSEVCSVAPVATPISDVTGYCSTPVHHWWEVSRNQMFMRC